MNLFLIKFHYNNELDNIISEFVIAPSQSKAVDEFRRFHKNDLRKSYIISIHSLNTLVYGKS